MTMYRVTLLSVGSLKTSWVAAGAQEYVRRLRPLLRLTVEELPASKKSDETAQRQDESERLLKALENREGDIWVLDEVGKGMTSRAFADQLQRLRDAGRSVTFVLGGAYGLTDAVRARGNRVLALSAMTFPHELCRVVFLEQLYRAAMIMRGSGYHH